MLFAVVTSAERAKSSFLTFAASFLDKILPKLLQIEIEHYFGCGFIKFSNLAATVSDERPAAS
jgi:hypothetical protein